MGDLSARLILWKNDINLRGDIINMQGIMLDYNLLGGTELKYLLLDRWNGTIDRWNGIEIFTNLTGGMELRPPLNPSCRQATWTFFSVQKLRVDLRVTVPHSPFQHSSNLPTLPSKLLIVEVWKSRIESSSCRQDSDNTIQGSGSLSHKRNKYLLNSPSAIVHTFKIRQKIISWLFILLYKSYYSYFFPRHPRALLGTRPRLLEKNF